MSIRSDSTELAEVLSAAALFMIRRIVLLSDGGCIRGSLISISLRSSAVEGFAVLFRQSIKELVDARNCSCKVSTNSLIIEMARRPSPTLTDAELRPMEVLWERGPSTVSDVVNALPQELGLSYSTVLTTLRILEQKGYVRHTKEGQAYVYHAVIDQNQAQKKVLKHILSRFFDNSPELLVLRVLETEKLDAEDLQRIRELIKKGDNP